MVDKEDIKALFTAAADKDKGSELIRKICKEKDLDPNDPEIIKSNR